MKRRAFRLFTALALSLFILCTALTASAGENTTECAQEVLRYRGLEVRLSEEGGIRSLYKVNKEAVAALEAEGYTVAYGAVMAVLKQGVTRGDALAVSGDAREGYVAASKNAVAVTVYATDSPAYAKGIYLDARRDAFAYTVVYSAADAAKYGTELVFAGFTALTAPDGTQTLVYDYAEDDCFGSDEARYGTGASMAELADRFANHYTESPVSGHYYNRAPLLRSILTLCGKEIATLPEPLALLPMTGEICLQRYTPEAYLRAARLAYATPEYADYLTSIVSQYSTKAADMNDTPLPVRIKWSKLGTAPLRYDVTVATDEALTQSVRTLSSGTEQIDVYNLRTATTYYYKVKATTVEGHTYETPVSHFKTADTVRWILADGVRNVRDMGGWNGLNQGLIYRGSELNLVGNHGLQITSAGAKMMTEELGIVTDLDFRAATENGTYGTESPLGAGVTWKNVPIGNFLSAFTGSYTDVMYTFVDYDNYPIYMHCWGGADRTGTVALMLSGLCGVKEEDLAIDLELTSFSSFGYRYRYDNTSFLYASTLARVKRYAGATLQEKFATCFREVYGMSEAEISNIIAINTQSGAIYDFGEGEHGDVYFDTRTDESFAFSFVMRDSTAVTSVTVDGVALAYAFDPQAAALTVYGDALRESDVLAGRATITFDDGATLHFYLETERAAQFVADAERGDAAPLFRAESVTSDGSFLTVIPYADGTFAISSSAAELLCRAGYAAVSLPLPGGTTVTVYDEKGNVISSEILRTGRVVDIPITGERTVFSTARASVTIMGVALVTQESSFVAEMVKGDYKAFFATGTNAADPADAPILRVTADNFTVPKETLALVASLGYTHVTFTVDIEFPAGTEGCYLAIRHAGKRYERLYPALTAKDGRVAATVTVAIDSTTPLQLITRTCAVEGDRVAVEGSHTQTLTASFIISELSFAKGGTEGAAPS